MRSQNFVHWRPTFASLSEKIYLKLVLVKQDFICDALTGWLRLFKSFLLTYSNVSFVHESTWELHDTNDFKFSNDKKYI